MSAQDTAENAGSDPLVSLYYRLTDLSLDCELADILEAAMTMAPLEALRLVFDIRNCRYTSHPGKGRKSLFFRCLSYLLSRPSWQPVVLENLPHIPHYGRYKDLWKISGASIACVTIWCESIRRDCQAVYGFPPEEFGTVQSTVPSSDNGEKGSASTSPRPMVKNPSAQISLAAKYGPTGLCQSQARTMLGMTNKTYRWLLTGLRSHLNIVEVKMSSNQWQAIDYGKVPVLAHTLYGNAFRRHDKERWLRQNRKRDVLCSFPTPTLSPDSTLHSDTVIIGNILQFPSEAMSIALSLIAWSEGQAATDRYLHSPSKMNANIEETFLKLLPRIRNGESIRRVICITDIDGYYRTDRMRTINDRFWQEGLTRPQLILWNVKASLSNEIRTDEYGVTQMFGNSSLLYEMLIQDRELTAEVFVRAIASSSVYDRIITLPKEEAIVSTSGEEPSWSTSCHLM